MEVVRSTGIHWIAQNNPDTHYAKAANWATAGNAHACHNPISAPAVSSEVHRSHFPTILLIYWPS
eukprot:scaffold452406_cov36-Prasinocladus_malaysianus.AAC.3